MIRPADAVVIGGIRSSDPFYTRILSLYLAYGEGVDFVAFWAQEIDGATVSLISRFEDHFSLWMTDGSDLEELDAFLRFQGAGSAMFCSAFPLAQSDRTDCISGEVLAYIGEDYISLSEIYEPDFKALYSLLQQCESPVFRVPDYMVFLSDLTHRRNRDKLHLIGAAVDGALASSVMTVSETPTAAILGAVATHPAYRRRGLSRELVRTLATRLRSEGRRVYVFSATEANTRFYQNSGFQPIAGFKEMFFK